MTSSQPNNHFCQRTRREFFWEAGAGFTGLALTGMLSQDGFLNQQAVAADGAAEDINPLAPKPPHFAPATASSDSSRQSTKSTR